MRLTKDNPRFLDSYLDAVQSPYLTVKDYTKENYKETLEQFIGLTKLDQGYHRYNIVLDTKQKHYLDWYSNKLNLSRSEIIRSLINNLIDQDKNYEKYQGSN